MNRFWRLPNYYHFVQLSGVFVMVGVVIATILFPDKFSFLGPREFTILILILNTIYHTILFILQALFSSRIFFDLSRYGWMIFFFALVYSSGGTASPILYLLIFPLLVSAVDLEVRQIKIAGILNALFFLGIFSRDIVYANNKMLGMNLFVTATFIVISIYIYKLVSDTLRERFEKEKARKELSEIIEFDRVKKDFITIISHDLRTPLSGAKWALEENHLDDAKTLINKSIEVVGELSYAIESQERNLKLDLHKGDIGVVVKEIIHGLKSLVERKKVSINNNIPTGIMINFDRRAIEVALANVIENAIKYSPGGKVSIDLTSTDDFINITVKDDGIGIKVGDKPYIFERFYRAKNAIAIEPTDQGIGLYTTKNIIELHQGSIKIDSEEGKGTIVTVILPVK